MTNVATPNLTPSSAIDDLIGNELIAGVRRTRRIPFGSLAAQLAATGSVASALNTLSLMAASGRITGLLSQLQALPGWSEGLIGFVYADDPAVNGEYLYTGGHLVRVAALPADIAQAAAASAIAANQSALAVQAWMQALQTALGGIPGITTIGANAVRRWQFMLGLADLGPATFAACRGLCLTDENNRLSILWQHADVIAPGDAIPAAILASNLVTAPQMASVFVSAATKVLT